MKAWQIKALRQDLGFTQEEFAQRLGVSFVTVNRWENDKVRPGNMAQTLLKELASKHGKKIRRLNKRPGK